jgi:hypothetical protein
MFPVHPALSTAVQASQPAAPPARASRAIDRLRVRFHGALTLVDEEYQSDNLAVLSLDRFAAGYQRLGQGTAAGVREAFGVQVPLGPMVARARPLEVSAQLYRSRTVDEHEAALAFRPKGNVEVVGKYFDLARGEGAALIGHVRRNANFDALQNLGVGGFVISDGPRKAGAYVWARIASWKGLFVGAGRHPLDTRYVVGVPNLGGPAIRYFALRATSGAQINEVLFASRATNMKPVDFYSTLIPIKGFDALITAGGVFAYQIPPISARGSGFNAVVAHRKVPFAGDFVDIEGVSYVGRAFVGFRYSGPSSDADRAIIGVPVGYQFNGGDWLTRNFLRVMPSYDRARDAAGVTVLFEWTR